MEKRDFENPNHIQANTELPRELFQKQVFTDMISEEKPVSTQPDAALPELDMHQRTVLDEEYAARKAGVTAPVPQQSYKPSAPPVQRRSRSTSVRRRIRTAVPEQLCSGETPTDAIRRIIREFAALLIFFLLVCVGFWGRNTIVSLINDNDYSSVVESTTYSDPVRCASVTFEDTAPSGGYAAAQAVCTALGTPITDSTLFAKAEEEPLFPSDVAACMEGTLPVGSVQLEEGMSNLDLLILIHENLRAGSPVIVLLSEEGADGTCLQYAVITAMDAENDVITAALPNGSTKKYTLDSFIAATRFETYENMPYPVKAGISFGSWERNTAIFVEG